MNTNSVADTILLIDDDELILRATKISLEHHGFNVRTAVGGEEGIAAMNESPDSVLCVILDFAMPDMDGKDVFQALRQIKPGLPIYIYTGCTMVDVKERFSGITPSGFIPKPLRIQQLVKLLGDVQENARTAAQDGPKPASTLLS